MRWPQVALVGVAGAGKLAALVAQVSWLAALVAQVSWRRLAMAQAAWALALALALALVQASLRGSLRAPRPRAERLYRRKLNQPPVRRGLARNSP